MWLTRVLLPFLVLMKPATADLGLPIPISSLKGKIHSLINNARRYGGVPFNKTLQDLEALPWPNLGHSYQHARQKWQAALVDLSWIQNYTLMNLTKAIDDQSSGQRKVLDDMYGNIEKLKEQVAEDRWLTDSCYELRGGPQIMESLNETRAFLESGLDAIRDALWKLDEVISEAQRVKPLTLDDIFEVVPPGMILAVWRAVITTLGSTGGSDILAGYLIVASNLSSQNAEEFKVKLETMVDWKDFKAIANTTNIAMVKFQSRISAPIMKLNQTVWEGYKPLSKNKLTEGAISIEVFLEKFNAALEDLNNSVTDETQSIFGYVETLISRLKFNFDQQIGLILDNAAEKIFTNGNFSIVENCVQNHPLINATVGKTINFVGVCSWEQIDYLPDLAKTIEEFLQSISAAAMAPLDDLQICNSSILDPNLCLKTFVTTHMHIESNDSTGNRTLMALINRLMKTINRVMLKQFAQLYTQLDSCFNRKVTEHVLEELQCKRMACYDNSI